MTLYGQEKIPVKTVIWYRSTQYIDFMERNLRFYDGEMVRPEKDLYIIFDSNDPHEVTLQVYYNHFNHKTLFHFFL